MCVYGEGVPPQWLMEEAVGTMEGRALRVQFLPSLGARVKCSLWMSHLPPCVPLSVRETVPQRGSAWPVPNTSCLVSFFDLIYYLGGGNGFKLDFLGIWERHVNNSFGFLEILEIFCGAASRIRSFLRESFFFGVTILFKISASQKNHILNTYMWNLYLWEMYRWTHFECRNRDADV